MSIDQIKLEMWAFEVFKKITPLLVCKGLRYGMARDTVDYCAVMWYMKKIKSIQTAKIGSAL